MEFNANFQSMWGPFGSFSLNRRFDLFRLALPYSQTTVGSITNFGGFSIGPINVPSFPFGAQFTIGAGVNVGAYFESKDWSLGDIDVIYPAEIDLIIPSPNTFDKGQPIAIASSLNVLEPPAELKTQFPQAGTMGLYIDFGLRMFLSMRLCAGVCTNITPVNFNFNTVITLFEIDLTPPDLSITYPCTTPPGCLGTQASPCFPFICNNPFLTLPYEIDLIQQLGISMSLDLPNVQTTSSLNPITNCLGANGEYKYIEIRLNLLKWLAKFAQFIPPPAGPIIVQVLDNFQRTIPLPFGGSLSWTIFSAEFVVDNSMKQSFSYCPTITGELKFQTAVEWFETNAGGSILRTGRTDKALFTVGNTINIVYPCNYEWMNVETNYTESNVFRNRTYDSISVYFAFKALEFNINIPAIQIIPRICIPPSRICANIPYPCPSWSDPFDWCTERVCIDPFCLGPLATPAFNFGFGPLWQATPQVAAIKIPYFDRSWEINGTETNTNSKFVLDAKDYFVDLTGTDVECYGQLIGGATATVTNGRQPYTYEWSNGTTVTQAANIHTVNNLPGGVNYVIVYTRDGCQAIKDIRLNEPQLPLIIKNFSKTDVSCNAGSNGSLSLTMEGGTPPYTYSWSPSLTNSNNVSNLTAGAYSVTVSDSKNCTTSGSFNIDEPYELIAISDVTNVNCNAGNDGKIDISVSGGSVPYSYLWSNGTTTKDIANIAAGNYTFTVTDRLNCTDILPVVVAQPSNGVVINTPVINNVSCNNGSDGSITTTVSGGTTPYTYSWSYSSGLVAGNFTNNLTNIPADTYTLTVKDLNNCSTTRAATVTEPSPIQISSTITNVNCFGDNTGIIDVSVSGGTGSYTYNWSNGGNTQDLINVPADTYTLILNDANNCEKQYLADIQEPANALAGFLTKKDVSCSGGFDGILLTTAIGGTIPYQFNWSNAQTTKDLDSLTIGNYDVEITDNKGCIINLNETIIEPQPLDITFVVDDVNCYRGTDGSIDATIIGGTTPYSLTWSDSRYIVLNFFNPFLNNLKADNYTLKVTDANNCIHQESIDVTEPLQPLRLTFTKEDVKCFGAATGSIDITVTGGTTNYTYSWSNGSNSEDVSNLLAGNYYVTITDAQNCVRVDSMLIKQPSQPIAISDSIKDVNCFSGNDGTIEIVASGGTSPYTYLWSNGNTTVKIDALTAGNYTITVKDILNCELIEVKIVNQPATPVSAVSTATITTCHGGADGSLVTIPSGGTPGYTYRWATSNFVVINDFDSIVKSLKADNYLLTVTDAKGCFSTYTVPLGEPDSILVSVTGLSGETCFGFEDGTITIDAIGGTAPYNYIWSTGANGAAQSGLAKGNYPVTIVDANNCELKASFDIAGAFKPLEVAITSTPIKCFGDKNGTATMTVSGGTPPYQTNWTQGDSAYQLYNLASGAYTITVFDNNGCFVKTGTFVDGPEDSLQISFTTDSVNCFGGNDGSIAIDVIGGTTPYKYYWADTLNLFNNNREVLNNLSANQYLFRVVDYFGCDKRILASIYEPLPISASFVTSNITCFGDKDGAIKVLASGGVTPYKFQWNDTLTGQTITAIDAGNYSVSITDFYNCLLVADTTIYQPKELNVSLLANSISCLELEDASIQSAIGGGTLPYTYLWNTGQTTSELNNLASGVYVITVTDANACFDTASVVINNSEVDCIYIPNSFTPNGDNKNDTWMIKNIGLRPNCTVAIFNKWGNKLFESKGYNTPWDGTENGTLLPSDTYYYVIDLGNGKPLVNGPVTIVR